MSDYWVYILANDRNKRFYTGITDELLRRNAEHKYGWYEGFTRKYGIHKLVYYEKHSDHKIAANREKLIKRWKREYKINVIEKMNPHWDDLFYTLIGEPDPATSAGLR